MKHDPGNLVKSDTCTFSWSHGLLQSTPLICGWRIALAPWVLEFVWPNPILRIRYTFTLVLHAIVIIVRLSRSGGVRSVVAESVLLRHQVLILNRGRKRAPNLRVADRVMAGLCTLLIRPARVLRLAIVLRPSTLLHFHKILTQQKDRMLFSPGRVRRPGPKGPTKQMIDAVVEMKRRNRSWGCKRIAQQIALAFGVDIDKDVVRRILAIDFRQKRALEARHGFLLLLMPKTPYGPWTCFDAGRRYFERTGFWW